MSLMFLIRENIISYYLYLLRSETYKNIFYYALSLASSNLVNSNYSSIYASLIALLRGQSIQS